MKNLTTYLLAAAVGLASLSSCKKDSETIPSASKTDMLTAKSWKVTDFKASGVSVYNSGLLTSCVKDNLTKFNSNKSTTVDEGATKCDPTDPQTQTGSWDFTTNETKLKVTDPEGDVTEATITTLNSTTLILTDPNGDGTGKPIEVTYTAQ